MSPLNINWHKSQKSKYGKMLMVEYIGGRYMDVHCEILSVLLFENFHNKMLGKKFTKETNLMNSLSTTFKKQVYLPGKASWTRNGTWW